MTGFRLREHYEPLLGDIELLPFRFDRRGDGRTVLTNLVGEYAVVPDAVVEALVRRDDTLDPETIRLLRARHLIQIRGERAPQELLARKLRTRMRRLPEFTALHIFVVTLRCEHSCPYCQVSRQSTDTAKFDMSRETADKALDAVFRSPAQRIKIEFQGGEPLLNLPMIQYIVARAKERNTTAGKDLAFVVATNLALLDETSLEFMQAHDICVSTSLDGPEHLHNANRPRPGRNSWELAVSGIARVRERLGYDRVSALMTTTERSLQDPKSIIDTYRELGFNTIFLRPMSPYGFAVKTKAYRDYDAERWLDFYWRGLDYILELNKQGIEFSEQYAGLVLRKMLTNEDPGYVDLMSPAGIGIAAAVYNYDGDVYASDEGRMLAEMKDTTFRLGNLHSDSFEEIFTSAALIGALDESFAASAPGCSECAYEPVCGADPVFHHATFGDVVGRKPASEFCKRNMSIFRRLIDLMEGDALTRSILRGWAGQA